MSRANGRRGPVVDATLSAIILLAVFLLLTSSKVLQAIEDHEWAWATLYAVGVICLARLIHIAYCGLIAEWKKP